MFIISRIGGIIISVTILLFASVISLLGVIYATLFGYRNYIVDSINLSNKLKRLFHSLIKKSKFYSQIRLSEVPYTERPGIDNFFTCRIKGFLFSLMMFVIYDVALLVNILIALIRGYSACIVMVITILEMVSVRLYKLVQEAKFEAMAL